MGVYRMKIKIIKRWENEEYKGKRESDAVPWPGFFPSFLLHAPAQHTYPSRTHMHDLFIKYDFDTWRSFKSKFYLSACVWIVPFLVPGRACSGGVPSPKRDVCLWLSLRTLSGPIISCPHGRCCATNNAELLARSRRYLRSHTLFSWKLNCRPRCCHDPLFFEFKFRQELALNLIMK